MYSRTNIISYIGFLKIMTHGPWEVNRSLNWELNVRIRIRRVFITTTVERVENKAELNADC